MTQARQLREDEFEFCGKVFTYQEPKLKVIKQKNRILYGVYHIPEEELKEMTPEQVIMRQDDALSEAWPDLCKLLVKDPSDDLLNSDDLYMGDVKEILAGFNSAVEKMTRSRSAALSNSSGTAKR